MNLNANVTPVSQQEIRVGFQAGSVGGVVCLWAGSDQGQPEFLRSGWVMFLQAMVRLGCVLVS